MSRLKSFLRSFVSFLVTLSFLAAAASGVVLYLAPPGRGGRWDSWVLAWLRRGQWRSVHVVLSFVFVAASLAHLGFNWRVLRGYLASKAAGWQRRLGALLAVVLTAGLLAGAVLGVGPLGELSHGTHGRGGQGGQGSRWSLPAGTAEMTLAEFAREIGIAPSEAAEALRAEGIEANDLDATVGDLADSGGVTPEEVFSAIREHYPDARPRRGRQGGGRGGGGGPRGGGRGGRWGGGRGGAP